MLNLLEVPLDTLKHLGFKFYTVIVILLVYIFLKKRKSQTPWWKYVFCFLILTLFIFVALDIVGSPTLSEFIWRHFKHEDPVIIRIQPSPFCDGISTDDFLNVLFFVPLGFILPLFWKRYHKWIPTILFGFIFSLFLECTQMISTIRQFEYNDLIMNTIGTFCGWTCFNFVSKLTKTDSFLSKDRPTIFEPVFITTICILSRFFLSTFL